MATVYAGVATSTLATAAAKDRQQANAYQGKTRVMVSSYTVPAGGLPVADVIVWGKLPKGARLLGMQSKIYFSAGAASSTINLGDSASAARYLAATSVTSAGAAIPEAHHASGAQFVTTADTDIQSVVAGAALQAGQVITVHLSYVQD